MMNIFIMFLVALFMAGYYLLDSPSQKIVSHDTEYAISQSDMRTIAQCATAVHNAQINGFEFDDICVQQNGIVSEFICLNSGMKVVSCDADNGRKKMNHYIVTATAPIADMYYNEMLISQNLTRLVCFKKTLLHLVVLQQSVLFQMR